MSQQESLNNNNSTILSDNNNISNNIENGNLHEDLMSSLLPCEAYEKDGFCARGSTCKFKHESAIGNVNLIEFLFEYETIVPKATSKKIRKINEINSEQVQTNSSQSSSSSTTLKTTTSDKPLIRKSKKTKIEKKTNPENSSSNNPSSSSSTVPIEEPYDVPQEYADINFEKPIIPFNFSFHTPTFHRQTTLQELIDINTKSTTNKKKAIVLAFMKEKEIYNSSHDRISYGRTFTKYKKTLSTTSNNTSTNTTTTIKK